MTSRTSSCPRAAKTGRVRLEVPGTVSIDEEVPGLAGWSLVDNFEWSLGYFGRLGLYRVDTTDPQLERRPTQAVEAVETFRQVAAEMGLHPKPPKPVRLPPPWFTKHLKALALSAA